MVRYEKTYVAVYLRVETDGSFRPVCVEWEDGRRYRIDKVTFEGMGPPRRVGAPLTKRYEIVVAGKARELYLETHSFRWFVERPVLG